MKQLDIYHDNFISKGTMFHTQYFICVVSLVCCGVVTCRTIYLELKSPTSEEITFLKKYGYLEGDVSDTGYLYTPQSISEAVIKLQAFAGIPQTGLLDLETKKLFTKKRCGVKDILGEETAKSVRNRRYIIQRGWKTRSISYRVVNGSSTLEKSRVEQLISLGLSVWAPHGGLRFHKQDEGRADIQVSFVTGNHGDGYPFDGPGRVVAHAFPPPHGAMHFDDDETWGDNPDEDEEDATDFFAVAIHEIGHALGLAHSSVRASVMYPYYQVPVERLHTDDILGMQELYLKDQIPDEPVESTESSSAPPSPSVPRFTKAVSDEDMGDDTPDLCMSNYDTLQVLQGKIYVFEEEWVWVLRDRGTLEEGSPRPFHDVFVGLPSYFNIIETIYEKQNGNIVIFKERDYWEFDKSFHLVKQSTISDYLIPSGVSELTTVFVSNYNNKTYLIQEERYWRFDESTGTMDEGYPKEMSAWRQVPYPVNAAIIWNGNTYFFQGPRFWRFDNRRVQAHEYYPLPTAQVWFACNCTSDMDRYVINDGP